ncbi:MAG: DUF4159 domain-containing protein [Candidatus Krumholzibacteria bacterium]|nr:DUF4159 domain-containing protein [Candidatus Krumholzibacteria bacterium]MDH5270572.1 DUF4159 domain-containing protein [Candidatus Krumholzibacteria bacterium]
MRNPFLAVLAVAMAGAVFAPAVASAQAVKGDPAEEYSVRIARLKYAGGGDWYADPSSIPNWLSEFERRTGVKTFKEEKVVTLTDENLRAYPFLYMTGHGTVKLSHEERDALRAYLEDGGFLYANDNYGMDASFRAMVRDVFPDRPFEELSADHPIFHCFYDLPGLPKIHEHDGKPPQAFGVTVDDRLVIFYSYESDIGDGLEDPDVHRDPPAKRELAMKMATNVLMYALTQSVLL